jgi:hypothetical protein
MVEWRGEETLVKSWRSSLLKLAVHVTGADAEERVVGTGDNAMVAARTMELLIKTEHVLRFIVRVFPRS